MLALPRSIFGSKCPVSPFRTSLGSPLGKGFGILLCSTLTAGGSLRAQVAPKRPATSSAPSPSTSNSPAAAPDSSSAQSPIADKPSEAPTAPAPQGPQLVGDAIVFPKPPYTLRISDKTSPNAMGLSRFRITSGTLVLSPKIQRERIQVATGQGKEIWQANGQTFVGNLEDETVVPFHGVWRPSLTAEADFDWVKKELYRGTITLQGEALLIFAEEDPDEKFERERLQALAQIPPPPASSSSNPVKPGGKAGATASPAASPKSARIAVIAPQLPQYPPGLGGLPMKPGVRVAAIEEKSRQPKYLQNGPELRLYEFGSPTSEDLTLPPKVLEMFKNSRPNRPAPKN